MLYKLICPWSEDNGKVSYAANIAEAVSIFATMLFSNGWGQAKISEDNECKNAIVVCPNKRPFLVALHEVRRLVLNPSEKNKIKIDKTPFDSKHFHNKRVFLETISVKNNDCGCVGFVAKTKDAARVIDEILDKKYPNSVLRIKSDKNEKIGYIDVAKQPTKSAILDLMHNMRGLGAKSIYSLAHAKELEGNKNNLTPSMNMLSKLGFDLASIDSGGNVLMVCQ